VIAGVALLVGIFIFYYLCIFPVEIQIQGTYLRYATIFLVERPANFVYVFVWILLFLGLAALIIFQQIAYSYGARWNNNLFNFFNPYFWGVVNFLELLLGLQFLKDACNSYYIQSSSSFLETPLIGTGGEIQMNTSTSDSPTCFATTGDQLL
jgi:hypothetical protein